MALEVAIARNPVRSLYIAYIIGWLSEPKINQTYYYALRHKLTWLERKRRMIIIIFINLCTTFISYKQNVVYGYVQCTVCAKDTLFWVQYSKFGRNTDSLIGISSASIMFTYKWIKFVCSYVSCLCTY